MPVRLTSVGACMNAAANLVDLAKEETDAVTEALNSRELIELEGVYGSVQAHTAAGPTIQARAAAESLIDAHTRR